MDTRSVAPAGTWNRSVTAPSAPLAGSRTTIRAWATPAGSSNSRARARQSEDSPPPDSETAPSNRDSRPVSRSVTTMLSSARPAPDDPDRAGPPASNSAATSTRVVSWGRGSSR